MSETQQRIEQSMSEIVVPMQEENCQCAPSTSIWGNLVPSELSRCVTVPSQKQPCQYAPTANLCCSPVPLDHLQYVSSPCQKPSRPLRRTVWPTVFLGTYSRREIIGIYSKLTPEITRRGIAGKDFTITTEIPHWQGYSQTKTLAETNTHIPITIRIQRRPPPPQLTEPTTENSNYTFLQQKPTKQKHPYQAVHWNTSFYDPKLFYEFCIENKIHRLKTDQKKQKNKRKSTKIIDTRLTLWIKLRGIRYYPRHAIKKATRTIRHWYRILQELTEPPHPPCTPQKLNLASRIRTMLQHLTPSVTLQKLYLQAHHLSQRLRTLLHSLISRTSGEAEHPGPVEQHNNNQRQNHRKRHHQTDKTKAAKAALRAPHEGDVTYRFHNVQGLADHRFRPLYLERARSNCDVLAIAEANWSTDKEAQECWWVL